MLLLQSIVFLPLVFMALNSFCSTSSVHFSTKDSLENLLINMIHQEELSISICTSNFSNRKIADALIQAHQRGVKVEIIIDRYYPSIHSPIYKMTTLGIPIYAWNPFKQKKGHSPFALYQKFCLFGLKKIWLGSFKFNVVSKERHQEDGIILEDEKIVSQYRAQFEKLKKQAGVPFISMTQFDHKRKN